MKTLTQFINPSLSDMTMTINAEVNNENYEVIENENLSDCNYDGLVVSGSLFSLTLFRNVTFDACVFFASKLENCEFRGCNFVNCEFQFSDISHCNFEGCTFDNCTWDNTPIKRCRFSSSFIDTKTAYFVGKGMSTSEQNVMEYCFSSKSSFEYAKEKQELTDFAA